MEAMQADMSVNMSGSLYFSLDVDAFVEAGLAGLVLADVGLDGSGAGAREDADAAAKEDAGVGAKEDAGVGAKEDADAGAKEDAGAGDVGICGAFLDGRKTCPGCGRARLGWDRKTYVSEAGFFYRSRVCPFCGLVVYTKQGPEEVTAMSPGRGAGL